jgi:hypothetical protein
MQEILESLWNKLASGKHYKIVEMQ